MHRFDQIVHRQHGADIFFGKENGHDKGLQASGFGFRTSDLGIYHPAAIPSLRGSDPAISMRVFGSIRMPWKPPNTPGVSVR